MPSLSQSPPCCAISAASTTSPAPTMCGPVATRFRTGIVTNGGVCRSSGLQKIVGTDCCLLEDSSKCTLGHVAGMIRNSCVAIRLRVEPNLMASRCLAVELKAARFQLLDNFAIAKPRQPAHFKRLPRRYSHVASPRWPVVEALAGNGVVPSRSRRASINFRATSRAISSASATVRPCATSPGSSSDVARNNPSGNSSTCTQSASSIIPDATIPGSAGTRAVTAGGP